MSESALATQSDTRPSREKLIVHDDSGIAHLMDTGRFEHCYRIAKLMATASLIPDHLRIDSKTKEWLPQEVIQGNCFLVVNQALRWGMDPFAVAPETYVVGGKLAFQGKLLAALINSRANLAERIDYTFTGTPGADDYTVTVSGTFSGEAKPRTIQLSLKQARTTNDMWKRDPEQKLIYTGVTKWARRWVPELVLGVLLEGERLSEDEPELRVLSAPTGEGFETAAPATTETPVEAAVPEPGKDPKSPIRVLAWIRSGIADAGITESSFEGVLRKEKIIGATGMLQTQPIEKLREIHERLAELIAVVRPAAAAEGEKTH